MHPRKRLCEVGSVILDFLGHHPVGDLMAGRKSTFLLARSVGGNRVRIIMLNQVGGLVKNKEVSRVSVQLL